MWKTGDSVKLYLITREDKLERTLNYYRDGPETDSLTEVFEVCGYIDRPFYCLSFMGHIGNPCVFCGYKHDKQ